jgi:LPS-assembly protein
VTSIPALFLVAFQVLGQLPQPQLAEPGKTALLTADVVQSEAAAQVLKAEGNVVLRSGGLLLRTAQLEYDTRSRQASAEGTFLLLDGNVALLGREGMLFFDSEGPAAIEDAELMEKRAADVPLLLEATNAAAVRALGRNTFALKAGHLERIGRGKFLAKELRLTTCDCKDNAPDLSISASSGDVELGERAILWWPIIQVKDVPVLPLPALYLPLSGRRTGLLFPRFGKSAQSGLFVDQPLFLTLGPSWDFTATPGYRFGVEEKDATRVGSRGPRAEGELRWAPALGTSGRMLFAVIDDLHHDVDQGKFLEQPRGARGELIVRHSTEAASGLGAHADVNLVSDGYYLGDGAVDLTQDTRPYLSSQANVHWRDSHVLASAATGWYQDINAALASPWPAHELFGREAPVSFQRPLALAVDVPRLRIAGPLQGALELTALRYQPIAPLGGSAPANMLSLSRLDASPSVAVPLFQDGPVHLEAYAMGRGDLSSYSSVSSGGPPTRSLTRARAGTGVWLGTELSRVFNGTLRHVIEPRLELRALTDVSVSGDASLIDDWPQGNTPLTRPVQYPVDEFDPLGDGGVQGVASLTTRIARKGRGDLFRLELGQGYGLTSGQASDLWIRLDATPGLVSGTVSARHDVARHRLTSLSGRLRLDDGRGNSFALGYDRLARGRQDVPLQPAKPGGTDQMRAGLDELFGLSADGLSGGDDDQASAEIRLSVFAGMSVRYTAYLTQLDTRPFDRKFFSHGAGLTLGSSCDCWKLDLGAVKLVDRSGIGKGKWWEDWTWNFQLVLTNLGSVGG